MDDKIKKENVIWENFNDILNFLDNCLKRERICVIEHNKLWSKISDLKFRCLDRMNENITPRAEMVERPEYKEWLQLMAKFFGIKEHTISKGKTVERPAQEIEDEIKKGLEKLNDDNCKTDFKVGYKAIKLGTLKPFDNVITPKQLIEQREYMIDPQWIAESIYEDACKYQEIKDQKLEKCKVQSPTEWCMDDEYSYPVKIHSEIHNLLTQDAMLNRELSAIVATLDCKESLFLKVVSNFILSYNKSREQYKNDKNS
jgi:hypothetical protein